MKQKMVQKTPHSDINSSNLNDGEAGTSATEMMVLYGKMEESHGHPHKVQRVSGGC